MEAYGKGGQRALQLGQLHNLARLYWYTIEFGLLQTEQGLRIFGAGILSSPQESVVLTGRRLAQPGCLRPGTHHAHQAHH